MQIDLPHVKTLFPGLIYVPEKNCLDGYVDTEEGDRYWLKIILSKTENKFPAVFEVDERIPRKIDRHINLDNTLCFTTDAQTQIYLQTLVKKISTFLTLIVVPYLAHNSYYEINKSYREEYSHPPLGIIEGYQDVLEIKNVYHIANLMLNRVKGRKLRLHDECYCGQNKLKKCYLGKHLKAYKRFRFIAKKTLAQDLEMYFLPVIEHLQNEEFATKIKDAV